MGFFANELSTICQKLESDDQPTRLRASQDLLKVVREDAKTHAAAREIGLKVIESRKDAHSVINALRAIRVIDGAEVEQATRLPLLDDPRAGFVKWIVASITDPAEVPMPLELLQRRAETELKISILRMLGRLKDRSAFSAMVPYLETVELRAHTVEALADLGDPRAIESLQNWLDDTTEAWEEDNHGPMLRVCDLARQGIEKLSKRGE